MTEKLSTSFKNIFVAGIGAAALTVEKALETVDVLVQKGELTMEQGAALNEELKHHTKRKTEKTSAISVDDVISGLDNMSPEELAAIKTKLADLDSKKSK